MKAREDIDEIMQLFTDHNSGLKPNPIKSQRQYCKHIIDAVDGHGKQASKRTLDLVRFAISIQSDYFAPRITSPKDLYYKMTHVMDYYRKNTQDNGRVISV